MPLRAPLPSPSTLQLGREPRNRAYCPELGRGVLTSLDSTLDVSWEVGVLDLSTPSKLSTSLVRLRLLQSNPSSRQLSKLDQRQCLVRQLDSAFSWMMLGGLVHHLTGSPPEASTSPPGNKTLSPPTSFWAPFTRGLGDATEVWARA